MLFIVCNFKCNYCTRCKNKTEKQPNIILILGDDIGFETVSAYGSTSYKTPRIDAMAKQGVLFEQCYAQPLCSPSRIQIMTGKSNFRNYEKWGYLDQNETTFAHLFKSHGYATCIAGKWQLKGMNMRPINQVLMNTCCGI